MFRVLVLARAQHRCERCGRIAPHGCHFESPDFIHAHHRLPRGRGGKHELTNGIALCGRCHSAVHDHTVVDWPAWLTATAPRK